MKFEIDWNQKSTWRGVIWFVGGTVATLLVIAGDIPGGMAVMSIAGMIAGGVGVAVKD